MLFDLDASVVLPLLDALRGEKLLDDQRYLENFVAYHAARGQGPLRIRVDLRRHGLQGPLVEEYLDAYPDWIALLKSAQLHPARSAKNGAGSPCRSNWWICSRITSSMCRVPMKRHLQSLTHYLYTLSWGSMMLAKRWT